MSSVHDSPVNTKPPTSPVPQFYRRPLPRECISFCSAEGGAGYFFLCHTYNDLDLESSHLLPVPASRCQTTCVKVPHFA